jgi:ABC-type sugar transport system substrate-binding protein
LIGKPRQKYANYIGQLAIDDYLAGYLTAESMIQNLIKNKRFDQNGNINILAFEGVRNTQFSLERVRGLKDVLKKYPQVKLLQSISTDWTSNYVSHALPVLLNRYVGSNVVGVWCASARLAEASAEIIKSQRLNILTVGTDWSTTAVQRVNQGDILSLAGGHVASVTWIIILLYDYHNGIDFGTSLFQSKVTLMDKELSGKYLSYIKNNDWSHIDFTRYSKVKNPNIMAYDFSLNDFRETLNRSRHKNSLEKLK